MEEGDNEPEYHGGDDTMQALLGAILGVLFAVAVILPFCHAVVPH